MLSILAKTFMNAARVPEPDHPRDHVRPDTRSRNKRSEKHPDRQKRRTTYRPD